MITGVAATAALGAAVSWGVVALVRDAAVRRGLLDVPNARSSHATATPRLGGLGIIAATLVALAVGPVLLGLEGGASLKLVALGMVVAAVSLIDDLRGLPALARLVVHLAAGAAAVAMLGPLDIAAAIGLADPPSALALNRGLTVLWIAGFMNAFNFMDGIDGIAAGQGAVAGAAIAVLGWLLEVPPAMLLGLALAAACLGFLPHNWSPATIFMGDVGSAFVGFLLATAPLVPPAHQDAPIGVLPFALIVWPFLFDTTLTFIRRAARGENVLAAHRSHLYQRLTQAGWSHARVAALYTALAAVTAVLVASPPAQGRTSTTIILVAAAGAVGLWSLVVHAERQRQTGRDRRTVEDSFRA